MHILSYLPLPGRRSFDVEADCARCAKGSQEEHGEAAGHGALQHLKVSNTYKCGRRELTNKYVQGGIQFDSCQ